MISAREIADWRVMAPNPIGDLTLGWGRVAGPNYSFYIARNADGRQPFNRRRLRRYAPTL
jgi:hypothetical protein